MTIDMDTIKSVLGDKWDPKGDYVCCTYANLPLMVIRGYEKVGEVQDPSEGDSRMLVFDRREVLEREERARAAVAEEAKPKPKAKPVVEKARSGKVRSGRGRW